MTEFSVWAPIPARVELEAGGERREMARGADGWWRLEVEAPAGTDYRFVVDGDPLPDPRSPWQPDGVHGPSRTVDHASFEWHDAGWRPPRLGDLVIYELHVGTFSPEGTFDGAVERLDHVVSLGASAVELMPVAEFAGDRGWGYDGVDLFAPHHAYGGPEGLKRLVDACHARGLAVILDVVYNHLGPEGNYLSRFAPYFTDRYRTPWGPALNFDGADSQPVRDHFVDNAVGWLRDYHFDGLRLDAVHAIVDTSAEHILEELRRRVTEQAGADRFLVAESDLNDPRVVHPVERGGHGIDAQWSDDLHHALHALLTGERAGYYADFGEPEHLARALARAYVYAGDYSPHRRRRHGRPHALPGDRFVVYSQNHDQAGNRAAGERSAALMSSGRLRIAAALVLTSPFVPLVFQGEEWGASTPFLFFSSHGDPAVAAATSEGRVREFEAFGWDPSGVPDPQSEDSFLRSRLDWGEPGREPHASLFAWYRALIDLRRREPALRDHRLENVRVEVAGDTLAVHRGRALIACNWGGAEARLEAGYRRVSLGSEPGVRLEGATLILPADSVAVLA